MGFRAGGYMSCWSTEPSQSGKTTKVRLSSSRKNKTTDQYEQDFSGFCTFIGKAHEGAKHLREKDRIKILECDVTTKYDKERQKEYVNYNVYDFEMADGSLPGGGHAEEKKEEKKTTKKHSALEEGIVDEDDLPF